MKEGSEIVFNCETNTEGAKAKWLKNEETIFESSKYMMSQRDNVFSLRIKDAQKTDEASYTISLTNQRAEQAKCTASAKVAGKKQDSLFRIIKTDRFDLKGAFRHFRAQLTERFSSC